MDEEELKENQPITIRKKTYKQTPDELPDSQTNRSSFDEKRVNDGNHNKFPLPAILGGDIVFGVWLRKQVRYIAFMTILSIIYISNSYSSKQNILEISRLQERLVEVRFESLTRSSEIADKCRQSYIESILKQRNDTLLRVPEEKPFVIKNRTKGHGI